MEGLRKNDDGSITMMVGPDAPPKGWARASQAHAPRPILAFRDVRRRRVHWHACLEELHARQCVQWQSGQGCCCLDAETGHGSVTHNGMSLQSAAFNLDRVLESMERAASRN